MGRRRRGDGCAMGDGAAGRAAMAGLAGNSAAGPAAGNGRLHRGFGGGVTGGAGRMEGEALLGRANDMAAGADSRAGKLVVHRRRRGGGGAVAHGAVGAAVVAVVAGDGATGPATGDGGDHRGFAAGMAGQAIRMQVEPLRGNGGEMAGHAVGRFDKLIVGRGDHGGGGAVGQGAALPATVAALAVHRATGPAVHLRRHHRGLG